MKNELIYSMSKSDATIEKKDTSIPFVLLAGVFVCLALFFDNCYMTCIAVGIICISIDGINSIRVKFFALLLLFILNYILYLDLTTFDFFPQAYDLLKVDPNFFYWFKEGHIHAIRLLIAYPGYILQCLFDIGLNEAFGCYCTIIFCLFFLSLERIKVIFHTKLSREYNDFILAFFVIGLFFIMNGRIAFAFLGYTILIHEMTMLYLYGNIGVWICRYIKIVIGVIFSTVSSGTMMVCISFIIISFIITAIRNKTIGRPAIRLIIIGTLGMPIILYTMQYVMRMIDKNVVYFGGGFKGVINMLQHGVGAVFGTPSELMIVWMLLSGCAFFAANVFLLIYVYRKAWELFPITLAINIAFYGAFVGFSTGTLILVPLVITFLIGVNTLLNEQEGQNERKRHF